MVVDDSPEVVSVLRWFVDSDPRFHVVGEAMDGASAIERARDLQPDVVLLDLVMPVMGGLEALPGLVEVAPHAKVMVLSGSDEWAGDLHMRGAHAFCHKDADLKDVLSMLAMLFPSTTADSAA